MQIPSQLIPTDIVAPAPQYSPSRIPTGAELAPETVVPAVPTLGGEFSKGISRGVDTTQGSLYAGAGLLGDLTGVSSLRDFGYAGYQSNMQEAQQNAAAVDKIESINSLSDFGLWFSGKFGELLPSAAVALGSSGAAAIAGRTVFGAASKAAAEKMAVQLAEKHMAAGVSAQVAEALGAREAASIIANRFSQAGLVSSTTAMEGGGMWGEDTEKHGFGHAPLRNLALGAVSGLSEIVGAEGSILRKLTGVGVSDSVEKEFKRTFGGTVEKYATKILGSSSQEATQEAFQEWLGVLNDQISDRRAHLTQEDLSRLVNAAAAGAVGGVGFGSAEAFFTKSVTPNAPVVDADKVVSETAAQFDPQTILRTEEKTAMDLLSEENNRFEQAKLNVDKLVQKKMSAVDAELKAAEEQWAAARAGKIAQRDMQADFAAQTEYVPSAYQSEGQRDTAASVANQKEMQEREFRAAEKRVLTARANQVMTEEWAKERVAKEKARLDSIEKKAGKRIITAYERVMAEEAQRKLSGYKDLDPAAAEKLYDQTKGAETFANRQIAASVSRADAINRQLTLLEQQRERLSTEYSGTSDGEVANKMRELNALIDNASKYLAKETDYQKQVAEQATAAIKAMSMSNVSEQWRAQAAINSLYNMANNTPIETVLYNMGAVSSRTKGDIRQDTSWQEGQDKREAQVAKAVAAEQQAINENNKSLEDLWSRRKVAADSAADQAAMLQKEKELDNERQTRWAARVVAGQLEQQSVSTGDRFLNQSRPVGSAYDRSPFSPAEVAANKQQQVDAQYGPVFDQALQQEGQRQQQAAMQARGQEALAQRDFDTRTMFGNRLEEGAQFGPADSTPREVRDGLIRAADRSEQPLPVPAMPAEAAVETAENTLFPVTQVANLRKQEGAAVLRVASWIVNTVKKLPTIEDLVFVVEDYNDPRLLPHVKASIKVGDVAKFDPKSGRIYLFADRIGDKEKAVRALIHEAVGHLGLRCILTQEQRDQFLRLVYENFNGTEQWKDVIENNAAYSQEDMLRQAEEFVAGFATRTKLHNLLKGSEATVWAKIKSFFARVLRGIGFGSVSEKDITNVLKASAMYLADTANSGKYEGTSEAPMSMFIGARGISRLEGLSMDGALDVRRTFRALEENYQEVSRAGEEAATDYLISVYQEHGVLRGADGKWRVEIADDKMRLSAPAKQELVESNEHATPRNMPLHRVIDHPTLFKAYPELRDVPVNLELNKNAPGYGYTNPHPREGATEIFCSGQSIDELLDILVHEIQHAVQSLEDFARGGSSEEFLEYTKNFKAPKQVMQFLIDNASPEEFSSIRRALVFNLGSHLLHVYKIRTKNDGPLSIEQRKEILEDILKTAGDYNTVVYAAKLFGLTPDSEMFNDILVAADSLDHIEGREEFLQSQLYDWHEFGTRENLERVARKAYFNLAGEQEAYTTYDRRKLSKKKRAAMYPDLDQNALALSQYDKPSEMSKNNFEGFTEQELQRRKTLTERIDGAKLALGFTRGASQEDGTLLEHNWTEQLVEGLHDNFHRVKRVMRWLKETGGKITDATHIYKMYEVMSNKCAALSGEFHRVHISPETEGSLLDLVAKSAAPGDSTDLAFAKATDLALAISALERNAVIKKRGGGDNGSGFTDAWCQEKIRALQTPERMAVVAKLQQINEYRLNMIENYNLLPKKIVQAWRETYKYYLPLKNWEDIVKEVDPEWFRSSTRSSLSAASWQQKATKRAVGRTTAAQNPVVHSVLQMYDVIHMAERAEVGRGLLQLVKDNADRTSFWKIAEVLTPETSNSWAHWKKAADKEGLITWKKKKHEFEGHAEETISVVDEDGNLVRIWIGDQAFRRALRGENIIKAGPVLRMFSKVTRLMAQLATSYNPEFWFTNVFRDTATATINMSQVSHELDKLGLPSPKNIAQKIFKECIVKLASKSGPRHAIYKYLSSGKIDTPEAREWAGYFEAMKQYGAMTTMFGTSNYETLRADLRRELRLQKPGTFLDKGDKLVNKLLDTMDNMSSSMENMTRLVVFKEVADSIMAHGRHADGRPFTQDEAYKRAASIALNLTVNFTRKGAWSPLYNSLYMFASASIGGSVRMLQTVFRRKPDGTTDWKNALKFLTVPVLAYALLSAFSRSIMPDDDDGINKFDKIPKYIKESNIIVASPFGDGGYVKIPLPYGFAAFWSMAVNFVDGVQQVADGKRPPSVLDAATSVVSAMFDNFSPIGTPTEGWTMLVPTAFRPIAQVATNRNFTGNPIYPASTQLVRGEIPDSQKFWSTTSGAAKVLAQALNELTGGTTTRSGAIDVSPDTIEHITGSYLGGMGRMLYRAGNVLASVHQGTPIDAAQMPITRAFYRTVTDQDTSAKFTKMRLEAQTQINAVDEMRKNPRLSSEERMQILKENRDGYRLKAAVTNVNKQLNEIRQQERNLVLRYGPTSSDPAFLERQRKLQERKINTMKIFLRIANKAGIKEHE